MSGLRFDNKISLGHIISLAFMFVAGIGDAMLQLVWAEAAELCRDSPTIGTIAAALELTEDQVDALFRAAGEISV